MLKLYKITTLSFFLLLGLKSFIRCQTVDSIIVEQAGELIKIHYKILNSNPTQLYRITVLCSINGGLKSELKSLSGDFGDNVVGGRSDYMVLWDVLKDADEVNSVDFSIRAELKRNAPLLNRKGPVTYIEKGWYVLAVGDVIEPVRLGVKLSYMKSWGISGMFTGGIYRSNDDKLFLYSVSLDITKRIINSDAFKMHLFIGIISSKFGENIFSPEGITATSFESGLICSRNRLAFSIGISPFIGSSEIESKIARQPFLTFIGLGIIF